MFNRRTVLVRGSLLLVERFEVGRATDFARGLARAHEQAPEEGERGHGVLLLFLVLHVGVSFSKKCNADKETRLGLPGVLTLSVVVASKNNVPRFSLDARINPHSDHIIFVYLHIILLLLYFIRISFP